jgi:glucokinase
VSGRTLLADVGGTNVRFALADPAATMPLLDASIRPYAVADFPSLAAAAAHYLESIDGHVDHGVFAVAGRVEHGQARLTNHPWVISAPQVAQALGLQALQLVNDFVAQAMSVRLLREGDVQTIGPGMARGQPVVDRTYAVLGPGTGLGVGALLLRDGRATALATEAGHVGFAPGNAQEIAILEQLAAHYGHVSNERLVSGGGLVNLHHALAGIAGEPWDDTIQPADITARAQAGDERCVQVVDLFSGIFGSVAGDMVLALGAWDGVYLTGGLVPHLLEDLQRPPFRQHFEAKGRYAEAMSRVPTLAVVHPQPGLLGAAAIACDLTRGHASR